MLNFHEVALKRKLEHDTVVEGATRLIMVTVV